MRFVLLLVLIACGGKSEAPVAATITVGGTPHTIKSAVVSGTHIALSTGTMDCTNMPTDAMLIVSRGSLGWTLGGTQFPQIYTAKPDTMAGAKLDVAGHTVVLSGSGTIGGHALELAGSIHAITCEE